MTINDYLWSAHYEQRAARAGRKGIRERLEEHREDHLSDRGAGRCMVCSGALDGEQITGIHDPYFLLLAGGTHEGNDVSMCCFDRGPVPGLSLRRGGQRRGTCLLFAHRPGTCRSTPAPACPRS